MKSGVKKGEIHNVATDTLLLLSELKQEYFMDHRLKNKHETLGVFSAFIIFFILKSIGVSSFVAFPVCMILGFGISYCLKK